MHHTYRDQDATLDQPSLNLDQSHACLFGNQISHEAAVGPDIVRTSVPTARSGHALAMLQHTSSPADPTRKVDTEPGRRMAIQATINRCDNSVSKVL